MSGNAQRKATRGAAILAASLASSAGGDARADDTIKHPGDHPAYDVEIEPHILLGWDNIYSAGGFGFGARFSIPIVHNGFVQEINNSVAISFGLDWVHYDAPSCYYNYARGCYGGTSADFFQFPVVMQWNFYVARKWSVFGEPGLYIWHGTYGNGVCYNGPNPVPCSFSDTGVGPAFWIGGRYHFNENIALTMRLGYPDILTIGVSFMP